jgi:hypothetical protein
MTLDRHVILYVKSALCCTGVKGFFSMKSKIFTRVFVVLTSLPFVIVSALSAPAVELFRSRYHGEDGQEFECVFETDERSAPRTIRDEKAAEIAAAWVTSFYHVQVGRA